MLQQAAWKTEKMVSSIITQLRGRSITFVGMMGCGKTAIGKIVAEQLSIPFFDADQEIEKAAGMSVADYFTTYGEQQFREGEKKVISRLLDGEQCILALGGGAFLSEVTRKLISQHALTLWLRADLDVLYARVMRRPGKRPLLQTANPRETLGELLTKRQQFYSMADIAVDTSANSKFITAERVLKAISTHIENEANND